MMGDGTPRAWYVRRPVLAVVLLTGAVHAANLGAGAVMAARVDDLRRTETGLRLRDLEHFASGWPLVAYDSLRYHRVLTGGYPEEPASNISFFPLYPLVCWPLAQAMPPFAAMLLVSNAAAIAGTALFFLLARRFLDPRAAWLATLLLLAYPPSMFLSAAYTEGVALLLFAAGLLLAWSDRYAGSALCGGLAAAVRPPGIVLAPVILWRYWRERGRRTPMPRAGAAVVLLGTLAVSGLLAYEGYLWQRYGRWDVYFNAQDNWSQVDNSLVKVGTMRDNEGRVVETPPLTTFLLAKLTSLGAWNKAFAIAFLLATLAGAAFPGPIPRVLFLIPLLIFALGYLPGNGARADSLARFFVLGLPTFLWLGHRLRGWPRLTLAGAAAAFAGQLVYAYLFTGGHWAG